jgi:hypothetical protein
MNTFDAGVAFEKAEEAAPAGLNDRTVVADADPDASRQFLEAPKIVDPFELAFHAGIMGFSGDFAKSFSPECLTLWTKLARGLRVLFERKAQAEIA